MAATKVGFIGLGMMGKPMVRNILKGGFTVTVFDIDKAAMEEIAREGASTAGSARELAAVSDPIVVMVANAQQVEEVVLGILEGILAGSTIIVMSTIEVDVVRKLAAPVASKGAKIIDSPVLGSQAAAIAANLVLVVGGDEKVLNSHKPVLQTMSREILHCGDLGAGEVLKAVNNYLTLNTILLTTEAMVTLVKAGVDPDKIIEATNLGGLGGSAVLHQAWGQKMLQGDYVSGYGMTLGLKDMGLLLTLAKQLGIPTPIGALGYELIQTQLAKTAEKQDFFAMAKALQELVGVEVKSAKK